MKKLLAIMMVFAFLASTILIAIPLGVSGDIPRCEMVDVGPRLRGSEVPLNLDTIPDLTGTGHHSYWDVGDVAIWLTYDDYLAEISTDYYELRAIGTVAEVWVQVPQTLDDWWSFPPTTPPKPNPTNPPIVTQEEIDYILEEFEANIYPIDTGYFGMPDFHDGSNAVLDDLIGAPSDYYYEATGRNVIMISNIRDEHYWTDYPYFIGGFYWGLYEDYFDRNIINIDCYDWEHRLGAEGTEWLPGEYVDHPYGYDSLVAHEYQHLIHADYVPGDNAFINEGCSMFAEVICGYEIPWGDINSYLYTPDNSLTLWGDQGDINILADYGAAALWAIYLNDRFGSSFWSDFMAAGVPGIDGLNALLSPYTFDEVYHDWRIANLIHTDTPGEGKYNYDTIDLGSPEAIPARTYDIKKPLVNPTAGTDFGSTITILGYDTGISRIDAYGSDYIKFNNLKNRFEPILLFDGDDYILAGTGTWIREDMDEDGDLEWYSTTGDLIDTCIVTEYALPAGTVTLTIDTFYYIEDYWDFGFVQVSTDGGATWNSISNGYTTSLHDPSAHPDIVANLPGLTGYQDWVTMDFDLSAYATQTVLIRFRYMTDWAYGYPGWWIDDIKVNGVLIDDADTTVVFGPLFDENDFMVTIIGVEYEKGEMPKYKLIEDIIIDDITETGMKYLDHFIEKNGCVLVITSPILGPTDYTFSVVAGE